MAEISMPEEKKPPGIDQKQKALDAFKDWSNYLLVTTVAALGWTTAKDGACFSSVGIRDVCILLFALSIVFAILTLALTPLTGENLKEDKSIYEVCWEGWFKGRYRLMDLCLPQHVLFLLGIIVYSGGTAFRTLSHSLVAIGFAIVRVLHGLLVILRWVWRPRGRAN
jgi:hypothetical protein